VTLFKACALKMTKIFQPSAGATDNLATAAKQFLTWKKIEKLGGNKKI
jgi:hypothetical protein